MHWFFCINTTEYKYTSRVNLDVHLVSPLWKLLKKTGKIAQHFVHIHKSPSFVHVNDRPPNRKN